MSITDKARALRRAMTEAERQLWYLLRSRRFSGFKFRRQVPIGPFIADFLCHEARLVIECDGGQHAESAADARRDAFLAAQGFRVLRFWNHEVFQSSEVVQDTIYAALMPPSSGSLRSPPSPAREEGSHPTAFAAAPARGEGSHSTASASAANGERAQS